jgi:hypothetical protein
LVKAVPLVFSIGADQEIVTELVLDVPPDELLDEPPELLDPLELPDEPPELPDEPPELLEPVDAIVAPTTTAAVAGEPKFAWPAMLVRAKSKYVPPAWLVMGTITVLALESPSSQVTVPLVAT